MKQHFELAIKNIVRFGDTDIFPYPYETRLFSDIPDEVIKLLEETHADFKNKLLDAPPVSVSTCSTVGYTGYRWATQLDPYWNAYFLGLVISLGEKLEASRLTREWVYSYRFEPNHAESKLFSTQISWRDFQQDSLDTARNQAGVNYVVSCDIADFYPRVYHHRLENALDRLDPDRKISWRIKKLLQTFSETNSYGLPVGGPAARMLAELALDSLDHLLQVSQVKFKRYVDDYIIFCGSREEAHSHLTLLSRKLMGNEGLTLQKSKTTIMSKDEFIGLTAAKLRGFDEDEESSMKAKFLSLPIRYDPYSPNAATQYEEIKQSLSDFDLLGMLGSELQKSRIDQTFSRHLVRSLSATTPDIISNALQVVFNSIQELYPIFPTILQVTASNWERLTSAAKTSINQSIEQLLQTDSFILKTEVNLAFLVRLPAKENTTQNQLMLVEIYNKNNSSILVGNLVTQAMGKWVAHYWMSDLKPTFPTMNPWQRRAFIVCSQLLGDEGDHWHTHNQAKFNFIEKLYSTWAGKRMKTKNLAEAL